MMLVGSRLRVILVTTHMALAQVPAALSLARYALASFPCAWVLALVPLPRSWARWLLAASLALQGVFFWLAGTTPWPP